MHPDPDLVVVAIALVSVIVGLPLAVGISRRLGGEANRPAAPSLAAGVEERLARIEHAVDAIAVEMERVSEGQRFTTRLLAERPNAERAGAEPAGADRAAASRPAR